MVSKKKMLTTVLAAGMFVFSSPASVVDASPQAMTAQEQQQVQSIYNNAFSAYQNGNYSAALSSLDGIYAYIENHATAQLIIGDSLRILGNPSEAADHLMIAYNLGSRDFPTVVGLSYCLMDLGYYEDAFNYLKESAGRWPQNYDVWWNLGLTAEALGDYPSLIASMHRDIAIDPSRSPEPFLKAGLAYSSLENYGDALRMYLNGLKYHPYNVYLNFHAGDLYYFDGNLDPAIQYLGRAVDIEPSYLEAWYLLGSSFLLLDDLDNADRSCGAMCQIDENADMTQDLCGAVQQKIMQRKMEEMQRLMEQQQIQQQIDEDIQRGQEMETQQQMENTMMMQGMF